jgi:predicted regulator of Ras-like GTPase activity (Roadblock/LC7/MglB family)
MREILLHLNQELRLLGSIILTPDGIMVAAALSPNYQEDAVAAFASSLLLSLKRSLAILGATGAPAQCVLNASNGKIIFLNMENAYLAVLAEPETSLDMQDPALLTAIHKIKTRRAA